MKNLLLLTAVMTLLLGGCTARKQEQANTVIENPTNNETSTSKDTPVIDKKTSKNKLDLSNRQLKKVPENVFNQTSLEELDLSGNQLIGAIQAEIRHLQKLKTLNLSNNLLTGVPAEIGQLKNLEILNLSNNQLTGLPYELGNLKNLKTLDISGNDYSKTDLDIIEKGLSSNVIIKR